MITLRNVRTLFLISQLKRTHLFPTSSHLSNAPTNNSPHNSAVDSCPKTSSKLKMLISGLVVSSVTGESKLENLQRKHKTELKLSRHGHIYPGTPSQDRVLLVKGEKRGVIDTVHDINNLIFNTFTEVPRDHQNRRVLLQNLNGVRFVVPSKMLNVPSGIGGRIWCRNEHLNVSVVNLSRGIFVHDESCILFEGRKNRLKQAAEIILDSFEESEEFYLSENLEYNCNLEADEKSMINLKLLVPSHFVHAILGNKGKYKLAMQEELSCAIKNSGTKNFFPGTEDQVFSLQGTKRNVLEVLRRVRDMMRGSEVSESQENSEIYERLRELRIPVPIRWGSMILSQNPQRLLKLKQDHKLEFVAIDTSGRDKYTHVREFVVVLKGEDQNVMESVSSLIDIMAADSDKYNLHKSLTYVQCQLKESQRLWYFPIPENLKS